MTIRPLQYVEDLHRINSPAPPDNLIRLHSAERVEPFLDTMWTNFLGELDQEDVRYYPKDKVDNLVAKISLMHGLQNTRVAIGDGSDRLIRQIFECWVDKGDEVMSSDPCFPMYKVYANMRQAYFYGVPYYNQRIDIASMIERLSTAGPPKIAVVIISNPNSPVGDAIERDKIVDLCRIAERHGTVVVVDEAYIEFSRYSSVIDLIEQHSNLIVLRTFSKAWGSAGVRCGYAVSNPQNIAYINKLNSTNQLCGMTVKWISFLLDHKHVVDKYVSQVKNVRDRTVKLYNDSGVETINTDCNWVYVPLWEEKFHKDVLNQINIRKSTLPWKGDKLWIRLCIPPNAQILDDLLVRK